MITPAGAILGTSLTLASRFASDPTGNPLTFAWDLGDGATAAGEVTTHVYATAGDFFPGVTVSNGEGSWGTATATLAVKSLTARWSGDIDAVHGRVSITQDGLDLTGTYQDDAHTSGTVAGRISATGGVTFTVTGVGIAPFTFTGTAGPDVETLVGSANGRDVANKRWQLERD